ncbi:hypothetical protein BU23DRAFT_555738 [Bimuria novae-zelandiae CBS 107.79]|uniref:Uncharacterized protein n=1 Tax=Bimuria novae-zelandiae CBS 107.79 TaxID=1447943 RepID=A0A6A5V3F0_9PLEO|nr:hypothetical protein BU23DRAFT_555738 [Bimuria novae-zelandiae CBS 107.79]
MPLPFNIEETARRLAHHRAQVLLLEQIISEWQAHRTFHPFPRLPTELRARIHSAYLTSTINPPDRCLASLLQLMPLAQACRLARTEFLDTAMRDFILPFQVRHMFKTRQQLGLPHRRDIRAFELARPSASFFNESSNEELAQVRRVKITPPFAAPEGDSWGW